MSGAIFERGCRVRGRREPRDPKGDGHQDGVVVVAAVVVVAVVVAVVVVAVVVVDVEEFAQQVEAVEKRLGGPAQEEELSSQHIHVIKQDTHKCKRVYNLIYR